MAEKKSRAKDAPPEKLGLDRGVRIVSVDGPFASRVLVDMPATLAHSLLDDTVWALAGPSLTREAVERDLAAIAKRDEALANSALAAAARTLALKLENPYTSATATSMCTKTLVDTMELLRELCPPEAKKDGVDELQDARDRRRAAARGAAAPDLPHP